MEKGLIIGTNIVETNAKKYQKKRYLYQEVERAIANKHAITILMGLRGAGKTVLLSQVLVGKKYAYLQLDYAPLKSINLYDLLQYLHKVKGINLIVLDEFQDCMDFSSLKAFHEETKGDVTLLVSGSSAVALYPTELTRRVNKLVLQPLSFREYLYFKKDITTLTLTINEIIEGKGKELIVHSASIKEYLSEALPYMLDKESSILELIDKTIRHDLVVFRKISSENVSEVEKVLLSIALSKGQTSFNSLSEKTGVEKTQVMRYIALLKDALIINELMPHGAPSHAVLKERKFYLTPPFRYGICKEIKVEPDVGMLREEFFIHHVFSSSPKYMWGKGMPDFIIGKKTFEVGGPAKKRKQLPDYLVIDEKIPGDGELPLVAFGFLY